MGQKDEDEVGGVGGEIRGVQETLPPEKMPQIKELGCKIKTQGNPSTESQALPTRLP